MFVYQASEKDCVGQDSEGSQECVICFEEFAVGDEMGRLVCLCKFHRVSLRLLQSWGEQAGNSKGANRGFRHVYGNGGLQKVQALVLYIHKLRLETYAGFANWSRLWCFQQGILVSMTCLDFGMLASHGLNALIRLGLEPCVRSNSMLFNLSFMFLMRALVNAYISAHF